jgi:hypothetical protein
MVKNAIDHAIAEGPATTKVRFAAVARAAGLLHPADEQLQVRAPHGQRGYVAIGAPGDQDMQPSMCTPRTHA